jgi:hypothetical protein
MNMTRRIVALAAFGVISLTVPLSALGRAWTDSTGEFSIEAEFVDLKDGVVQLRRDDNARVIKVPLKKLAHEDRRVAVRTAREAEAPPLETAGRRGG